VEDAEKGTLFCNIFQLIVLGQLQQRMYWVLSFVLYVDKTSDTDVDSLLYS